MMLPTHPPRRWDFCIPSTRDIIIILTFNHSFLHNRPAEKSVHLFGQSGEAATSSEILIDNIETVRMRALKLSRAILSAREYSFRKCIYSGRINML